MSQLQVALQQLGSVNSLRHGCCSPDPSGRFQRRRRPRRRRRGGGGGNGESCRGETLTCRALKHGCFRGVTACRVSFAGTWTPSLLLVCRTCRRCSGGGVCVGYSLGAFPDGPAADDGPAATGSDGVAAFSATATNG